MFQQTRNKILFLALVVPALVTVLGGQARAQAANKTLPVELIGQETNMWCWAAATQMTTKFAGVAVKQCDQASASFGRDCCVSPTPDTCINGGWPDFLRWGFNTAITDWGNEKALPWAQLRAEIDANRLVTYAWGWNGGGGHIMIVVGYQYYSDTDKYVYIRDPWPPGTGNSRWITYAEFVSGTDHYHQRDYYNTVKKP